MSQQLQHPQQSTKQRRKVLTEEEYNSSLSVVVQRNYFPDLPHLAETAALHERRAAGDVAGAVAIRRAMRQRQDEEERDLQQQAAEEQDGIAGLRSTPRPLHHESLTNFHARVTSEDNAEYEEQQTKEVEANRKRQRLEYGEWARLTSKKNTSVKALPPSNTYVASPLPLASDQFNATPHRKSMQQIAQETEETFSSAHSNGLFFLPNSSTPGTGNSMTTRLALPPSTDTSASKKSNAAKSCQDTTMPPPSKVGAQNQISSLSALVEYIPKESDNKKRIEPAATRFPSQTMPTMQTLALHRGNVGLNLEESESEPDVTAPSDYYSSATDASTDLDSAPTFDLATDRRLGKRRKQKELETMVQMTPVIVPGKSSVDDEPIMTWGEVSATPLVLHGANDDDDNDGTPSFGVSESARDRAAEQARIQMERRSRLALATPKRRAQMPQRPSSRLPTRTASSSSARSASSFGTALRSSYTPLAGTDNRNSSLRRSSSARPDRRATPKLRSGTGQPRSSMVGKPSKDLTKGLLQIP